MSPFIFRPIATPQMMPYAFYRPPMPIPMQMPMQMPVQGPMQAAGGLSGFLANANTLMSNAEKFTPYMQQLTPMMKNLPALWRIYKSFKQSPESPVAPSTAGPPQQASQSPLSRQREPSPVQQPVIRTARPSVPKIYQPTWP